MEDLFQLGRGAARRRIVVAMSGGVDSSVVAALAAESGAETIGITLQLYDHGAAVGRAGSCCAGKDIADARAVADRLGIAHYVFDYASAFRSDVIERFADDYVAGRTPIPCVRCNQGVKFTDLLRLARELGADCLATGHYARRVDGAAGPELHRAIDTGRDQSYFLFATTRAQLEFLRFPLGGMPKAQVRALAEARGLATAAKPDSQDICFVPDGDYAALVRRLRPEAAAAGDIVDTEGQILGRHRGIAGFTVGQRRGLEIGGAPEPLYVVRIEPEARRIVAGPRRALAVRAARLGEINWLGGDHRGPLTVKVRSLAKPVAARFDGGTIHFAAPEYGVAPGQAAVLYDGDRLLGGGWIEETFAMPTLRRAQADDAGRLALLGGASFLQSFAHDHPGDAIVDHVERHHGRGWYAAKLADPAAALWILETERGAPIGYALLSTPELDCPTGADDLELKRIYLLAGWQSGGWGAKLLEAAEAEARARGARRLLLCVYTHNVGAQRFYARRGFADTGATQHFMVGDVPFTDQIWAKPLG